jgi:hypothetical protein
MLGRASNAEALGVLSGEASLASKPEELLIAIARRCRKLMFYCFITYIYIYIKSCFGQLYTSGYQAAGLTVSVR